MRCIIYSNVFHAYWRQASSHLLSVVDNRRASVTEFTALEPSSTGLVFMKMLNVAVLIGLLVPLVLFWFVDNVDIATLMAELTTCTAATFGFLWSGRARSMPPAASVL